MSNNFSFNIYADSITGRRPKNEDSYLYVTNDYGQTLIVVCDGIGSEYHSEVASQLSTKIFEKNFVEEKKIKNFKKYYFNCVEEISKVIAEFSIQKIDGKKIGTTVVVCLLEGDTIQGAWLGDSRVYLYSNITNAWQKMTIDHNLYNHIKYKFQQQRSDRPDMKDIIDKNEEETLKTQKDMLLALTKCLESGSVDYKESSFFGGTLAKDDVIMCCTDGCYNWIKLDDVDDIVRDKNDSNPAKTIVQKALDNNSNDNITCVIAKVI